MDDPVIRREESHFAGAGGQTLFRRGWIPKDPRRVLVLVHGYGEHSGRYEHLASWFADRGSAVHALDLQGHGRSQGPRGHVRRFDDFLDDVATFLAIARDEHAGVPVHLVGHSMGGLIACAFACRRGPDLDGLVLSGPLLRAGAPPSSLVLAAGRVLRPLLPRFALSQPIDGALLSRDPRVGDAYQADPLVHQVTTLSLGIGLLDAARATVRAGAEIRVPTLLLHGEDDRLCLPSGTRELHEQIAPGLAELRIYPGLRHEIFNEPERESVYADVLAWIEARESSRR